MDDEAPLLLVREDSASDEVSDVPASDDDVMEFSSELVCAELPDDEMPVDSSEEPGDWVTLFWHPIVNVMPSTKLRLSAILMILMLFTEIPPSDSTYYY